jgi:guanylate kinase
MDKKLLILTGKSSSGKDTIARLLEKEHGYNFIVSTTTRPMRPGESNRNPYNFVTNEEFERLISGNELIEYREYHTLVNNNPEIWYYGVEKKEVDPNKSYVVVLDTVGLREFKIHFPEKVISFFIHVDDEIRKQRCLSRGDFDEFEWNRRLEDDKIRFSSEVVSKEMDFVIDGDQDSKNVLNDILNRI